MNTIINGIILSKYPDAFKLNLLDQVLKGFDASKPVSDTIELLTYATELALNKGKLERDISLKLLQKVSTVQPTHFNEFFKFQSIETIIFNTYQNQAPSSATAPSINFILQVLKLKAATTQDAKIEASILTKLYMWLYSLFKPASSVELQENLCALLTYLGRTNDFLFISSKATTLLQVIVTWLSTADFINTEAEVYNRHVQTIADFMLLLWNNFSAHLVLETLNHVFIRVSSAAFPSPPSPAVANVLHYAPSSLIWAAAPYITANANIKDPQLELALSRIVKWPLTENTANWVVGLLQGLIEAKKFTVLARITIKSVHTVLNQIWVERTSKGALHVFEQMLLGFQHAPDAFHFVVPALVPLIHHLSASLQEATAAADTTKDESGDSKHTTVLPIAETGEDRRVVEHSVVIHLALPSPPPPPTTAPSSDSATLPPTTAPTTSPSTPALVTPSVYLTATSPKCRQVLEQLGRLVWVLVIHHMGHPELYAPLVSELTSAHLAPPPDGEARALLLERAWTSLKDVKLDSEIRGRQSTSKGGLVNLGNTCYQNSMLQSLFMTDQLRSRIFSLPLLSSKTPLAQELQRLFAFLSGSLRDAWDPKSLYRVFPEWYRSGLQQDSCEFGKYLLDQLDTQLKGLSAPISSIFEGKTLQTITCRNCKTSSSVVEAFWDLPLAFSGEADKRESVDGMLDAFFLPETFEGSNQYSCSKCQSLQDAEKTLCILDPPPTHLMLTLKRFAFDPQLKKQVKILKEIRYPEFITLPYNYIPEYCDKKQPELENGKADTNGHPNGNTETPTNTTTNASTATNTTETVPSNAELAVTSEPTQAMENTNANQPLAMKSKITQKEATYVLYGVIMHSGTSAERGHYYTYARSSKAASKLFVAPPSDDTASPASSSSSAPSSKEGEWMMFNDSQVRPSSFESFTSITKTFPTDVAYILFYARANTESKEEEDKLAHNTIPAHLQAEIVADNKRFLTELEAQQQRRSTSSFPTSSSHSHSPYDDNDKYGGNGGGAGGFGGGGGFDGGFGGGFGGGRFVC